MTPPHVDIEGEGPSLKYSKPNKDEETDSSIAGEFPDEFLRRIPKTDLHCHLDGSIRIQTLIDLCKEQNLELPSYDVEELKTGLFKERYNNLEEYLQCFMYTTAALRQTDALER
eukprot:13670372-Ditylum_brightwellii.AAC.1